MERISKIACLMSKLWLVHEVITSLFQWISMRFKCFACQRMMTSHMWEWPLILCLQQSQQQFHPKQLFNQVNICCGSVWYKMVHWMHPRMVWWAAGHIYKFHEEKPKNKWFILASTPWWMLGAIHARFTSCASTSSNWKSSAVVNTNWRMNTFSKPMPNLQTLRWYIPEILWVFDYSWTLLKCLVSSSQNSF